MEYFDIRASTDKANTTGGTYKLSELNAFFESDGFIASKTGKDISEITYFVCIKVLSESLGKLNNKVYQKTDEGVKQVNHYLNGLVGLRPNPYMPASVYNATIEFYRNHYGNAFVWIDRAQRKDGSIYTKLSCK